MKYTKSAIALAAVASLGLVGCGGSSSGGGSNNGGNNGGNGGNNNGTRTVDGQILSDVTRLDGRGRWGSLVLSGYGRINNGDDNNQTTTEAVPDGVTRWFGGLDNSDSSGRIRYVILAETGEAFRPDEEVQGLTIEGSGAGTDIQFIQVTNSDDDGIEWFGGAADTRFAVIQGVSDDSLDMDLGYQGTIKNALVIQGRNFGDRGIESDNNGSNFGALPKSSPILANITILGNPGNDGSTMGALHREGYGGQVYRSVYADDSVINQGQFSQGCLDVDNEVDEDLRYGDVLFNCAAGDLVGDSDNFEEQFSLSDRYDVISSPAGFAINPNTLAITTSETTSSQFDGPFTTPNGNSVTPDDYFGAIDPNGEVWWQGWTLRQNGIDGNLPGGEFHPLEAEIVNGQITPSATNQCSSKGTGLAALSNNVTVFGQSFPVCLIRDGELDGDFTLSNDHIYLLDGTVQVGNGDVESAFDRSTVREDVLTIQAGTQIMAISNTAPSLVITRGSRININGTAAMPVIFGAVDVQLQ